MFSPQDKSYTDRTSRHSSVWPFCKLFRRAVAIFQSAAFPTGFGSTGVSRTPTVLFTALTTSRPLLCRISGKTLRSVRERVGLGFGTRRRRRIPSGRSVCRPFVIRPSRGTNSGRNRISAQTCVCSGRTPPGNGAVNVTTKTPYARTREVVEENVRLGIVVFPTVRTDR